jgi:hypothetical protein
MDYFLIGSQKIAGPTFFKTNDSWVILVTINLVLSINPRLIESAQALVGPKIENLLLLSVLLNGQNDGPCLNILTPSMEVFRENFKQVTVGPSTLIAKKLKKELPWNY